MPPSWTQRGTRAHTESAMNEFGVVIGRFQPFHNAHLTLVRLALTKVQKLIIVLGSASQAATIKNPWSTQSRIEMIRACLTQDENARIEFVPAKDYLYNNNLWVLAVQEKIDALTDGSKDIVLIGHKKDKSSFYLELFPQWEFVETGDVSGGQALDATKVRNLYFICDLLDIKRFVPEPVFDILKRNMMKDSSTCNPDFLKLKEEFTHIAEYKELWSRAPYPPTFVTTDAVIIKSGHVLVVRRAGHPGKGLIALPGGFLNQDELITDCCIRETKEETSLKVSKDELLRALREQRVFDHPNRSLRGRTITHAFCFDLGMGELPKVKGGKGGVDDTEKAWWMPLRDVLASEEQFFEDHFHIINYFVNKF